MDVVATAKTCLPKSLVSALKQLYDKSDLWFNLYLRFSKKRLSPYGTNPILMNADGVIYSIDPRDHLQRRISMSLYEKASLNHVLGAFPTPGVFLDVGANVGFFALNVAKKAPEGTKAYAFEADPKIFHRLEENRALNHVGEKLLLHNLAVTSHSGPITFNQTCDSRCSGAGSLNKFSDMQTDSITVQGTTIDAFLEKEQIQEVRCLKVDIEGSELELLKGAKEALKRRAIKHILIEYNGPRLYEVGVTFEDFIAHFPKNAFTCTYNRHLIEGFAEKNLDPKQTCDNFFFSLKE